MNRCSCTFHRDYRRHDRVTAFWLVYAKAARFIRTLGGRRG